MTTTEVFSKVAKEFKKDSNEEVLVVRKIRKVNKKGQEDKRLVILTESRMWISHRDKPRTGKQFLYFDIQKIEIEDGRVVVTCAGPPPTNTVMWGCKSPENSVAEIVKVLNDVLLQEERPQCSAEFGRRSRLAGLNRLRAKWFSRKRESAYFPEDVSVKYRTFLWSRSPDLDLCDFQIPEYMYSDFIESLLFVPHLKRISLPEGRETHWPLMGRLLFKHETLESVTTREPFDGTFAEFCDAVERKPANMLKDITFGQRVIKKEHIEAIARLYRAQPIGGIAFLSCRMSRDFFGVLYEKLIKPAKNLTSIALNNLRGVPLSDVIHAVQHMSRASLERCDLDLSVFFREMNRDTFEPKSLNLSGNIVTRSIGIGTVLPRRLRVLWLNKLEGDIRHKLEILGAVVLNGYLEELRIQDLGGKPDALDKAMENLSKQLNYESNQTLDSLYFDNNYITPQVLCFFERLSNLHLLSVSGCVAAEKDAQILGEYLANNRTITEFHIDGTIHQRMDPPALKTLLRYMEKNRSIRTFRFAHNTLDSETFDALADMLLRNRIIESISFEDCGLTDPNVLKRFLDKLTSRGAPITIPLPKVEIERMNAAGVLDKDQEEVLVQLTERLKNGYMAVPIPRETVEMPSELPIRSYHPAPAPTSARGTVESEVYPYDFHEWDIQATCPPAPDNTDFFAHVATQYCLSQLYESIKKEPIA